MTRRSFFGVALGLVLLMGTKASAVPTLDFGVISPTTGSISYAGGVTPLVGSGIDVDNVVGLNTPANNLITELITGGLLNFTSGNFVSSTATSWTFGAGAANSITITGGIPTLGIAAGSALLTGQITSATVIAIGGTFKIAGAAFLNVVDPVLAAHYGLGGVTAWTGNFNISFNADGLPPGGFSSSQVLSGDVVTSPAPEPNTLALAGMAVLGGLYAARQRVRFAHRSAA